MLAIYTRVCLRRRVHYSSPAAEILVQWHDQLPGGHTRHMRTHPGSGQLGKRESAPARQGVSNVCSCETRCLQHVFLRDKVYPICVWTINTLISCTIVQLADACTTPRPFVLNKNQPNTTLGWVLNKTEPAQKQRRCQQQASRNSVCSVSSARGHTFPASLRPRPAVNNQTGVQHVRHLTGDCGTGIASRVHMSCTVRHIPQLP